MRYALMLSYDESEHDHTQDEKTAAVFEEFFRQAGERLHETLHLLRSPQARTVRIRQNGLVVEDGPFTETKEQIGGILVVDVQDLDEAIEFARNVPVAHVGSVEIRPIWDNRGTPDGPGWPS